MINIQILSRKALLNHRIDGSTAVIAFCDYDTDNESLAELQCPTLALRVSDTITGTNAMQATDAEAIKEFVATVQGSIETLIISCSAGISRSSGVAAAVLKGHNSSDLHIWSDPRYSPNPLCYNAVLKAYGMNTAFTDNLVKINKKAIREKVWGSDF